MKQPKKLTREQKECLSAHYLNCKDWMLVEETEFYYRIINKNTGHGIEVGFPGFETVAFWTPYPAEAPFLCVEPWNGSGIYATEDDEFVHKNHVQKLETGKSKTYGLTMRII